MHSQSFNCPQCGDALARQFRHAKLIVCQSCDSTIFLEDDAVRLAGKQSALTPMMSLLKLNVPFEYQHQTYVPIGHVRYRYDRGYWDEWWVIGGDGKGIWVSVDEGDFAFETEIKLKEDIKYPSLILGRKIGSWIVTELDRAYCEGYEGELPEVIEAGESFDYAHLSGPKGALMTLEFPPSGLVAYKGKWIDPFEVITNG